RITFTPPSRHIAFIGDYTQISNFRVFYDFSKHPFGGISTQQQDQQRIGKVSHACHYHHIEVHSLQVEWTLLRSAQHPFPSTGASTGSVNAARTVFWLCAATITASRGSVAA
ncbi:uncharacterized protein CLUP02_05828, partial [Colletotrichum lupini]